MIILGAACTCTMKGEEFARTAEMSVEAAYRTREAAANLAGGDILRRLKT